jgi:hypothetical protein
MHTLVVLNLLVCTCRYCRKTHFLGARGDNRSGAIDMKRFRLSTLMLLIAIIALCGGLAVQHQRALRREAELRARLDLIMYRNSILMKEYGEQPQAALRQSSTAPPQGAP